MSFEDLKVPPSGELKVDANYQQTVEVFQGNGSDLGEVGLETGTVGTTRADIDDANTGFGEAEPTDIDLVGRTDYPGV